MKKVKVSAISYLNTTPFVYGLQHSEVASHIELSLDKPAFCAQRLMDGTADIGIVPSAIVPQLPNYKIISDYCIGAVSPVRSVMLFSNAPLNQIDTIYLDHESRTSVMLCRILCSKFWHITPDFEPVDPLYSVVNNSNPNAAFVLIGDKAFTYENRFAYVYDLAEEWIKYKQLPFTFATWTAVTPLSDNFIALFNQALQYGVNHIREAVEAREKPENHDFAYQYLTQNISFTFDNEKKKGLVEFWNLALEEVKSKYRSCE